MDDPATEESDLPWDDHPTNMEITNIDRAELLLIPGQYYFFLIRGKRQDGKDSII